MSNLKQQLEASAAGILATAQQSTDPKTQFCTLWNGTIKPTLELVKNFTGPKIDNLINELETAADGICNGSNPDQKNFCNIWNSFHLEFILKGIEIFVGPNVKKVISKFIEIADSLCAA